jgi:hypothetical protein
MMRQVSGSCMHPGLQCELAMQLVLTPGHHLKALMRKLQANSLSVILMSCQTWCHVHCR